MTINKVRRIIKTNANIFSSSHDLGKFLINIKFVDLINTDMSLELSALSIILLFYLGLLNSNKLMFLRLPWWHSG